MPARLLHQGPARPAAGPRPGGRPGAAGRSRWVRPGPARARPTAVSAQPASTPGGCRRTARQGERRCPPRPAYVSTARPAAVSATPHGSPVGRRPAPSGAAGRHGRRAERRGRRGQQRHQGEQGQGGRQRAAAGRRRAGSAAAPSKGRPVRSPRRWRKSSSASIAAERAGQRRWDRGRARHQPGRAQADRRQPGARAGCRGPCGPPPPRSARSRPAGPGTRAGAARDAPGRPGGPARSPGCTAAGSPVPAEAAATSSRRSWTSGWAPRARRRASTRPGLPSSADRAGRCTVLTRRPSSRATRAVGERRGLRVVRGEHDGDAVRAGRGRQRAQHLGAVGAVQRRRRLVGEEHRRARRPGRGRWRPAGAAAWSSACGRLRAQSPMSRRSSHSSAAVLARAAARCRAAAAAGRRSPRRSARGRACGSGSIQPKRSRRSRSRASGPMVCTGDAVEPDLALLRRRAGRTGSAAAWSCRCRAGR